MLSSFSSNLCTCGNAQWKHILKKKKDLPREIWRPRFALQWPHTDQSLYCPSWFGLLFDEATVGECKRSFESSSYRILYPTTNLWDFSSYILLLFNEDFMQELTKKTLYWIVLNYLLISVQIVLDENVCYKNKKSINSKNHRLEFYRLIILRKKLRLFWDFV